MVITYKTKSEVKNKMCKYCNLQCRDWIEKQSDSWIEKNTNVTRSTTNKIANCNGFVETDKTYIDDINEYMSAFS